MYRKLPKLRLIDDSALAIQRVKPREEKDRPQFRSSKHLAFIRSLTCLFVADGKCAGPIEAAHLRIGTDGGGSLKPSDIYTHPNCAYHHKYGHVTGERALWSAIPDDPVKLCLEFALRSSCARTQQAAAEEFARRYADSRPLSGPGIE